MTKPRKIILASKSKGRKKLLEQIGLTFSTEVSDYEEDMSLTSTPTKLVKILSQGKARAVARRHKGTIVIGADSVCVLENKILGKPRDEADARAMLQSMSGKTHTIISGLTVIDTELNKEATVVAETQVHFRRLTKEEIDEYVTSGEPLTCAGSYAIQGEGATLVKKIEGEHSNVVGLPLSKLKTILRSFGVSVLAVEQEQV